VLRELPLKLLLLRWALVLLEGRGPRRRGPKATRRGRRGPHAGAAGGARAGEKKEGARREEKGRERKRERKENGGEGSSPRGSDSGDHRLQNLGHHRREREMGERERGCCAGEIK
jgi:hypothetical protein